MARTPKDKKLLQDWIGEPLNGYVFFREGGFYTIELKDDEDARKNALCNPGTIRVEDLQGNVIWPLPENN